MRRGALGAVLAAAVVALAACGSQSRSVQPLQIAGKPCRGTAAPSRYDHVVLIVMENHGNEDVAHSSAYLDGLAAACGTAAHYHAVAHPSLPNYLALTSGTTSRDHERLHELHERGALDLLPSKGQVNKAEIFGANYFGVVNNGGNVNVQNSNIRNIGEVPFNGTQHGVGIYWAYQSGATGDIGNNTVSQYQKGGIVVNSGTANVHNNTVTGLGRVNFTAQNGIQMAFGGSGSIHNNVVSGNDYTGGNPATPGDANVNTDATGILVFGGCGDPTSTPEVNNNSLSENDIGVYYVNESDDCTGVPSAPTNGSIHNNTISNGSVTNTLGNLDGRGYQAGIAEFGNGDQIHNNAISGVGYAPTDMPSAFILPIDLRGSLNPNSHNNTFNGSPYNG
ncbi:MAG TPA: hypothetical protein VLJ76_04155 [Gaiellaceae bacterium]|nr:hypothetical protein [Gaiellaceae bacterium]